MCLGFASNVLCFECFGLRWCVKKKNESREQGGLDVKGFLKCSKYDWICCSYMCSKYHSIKCTCSAYWSLPLGERGKGWTTKGPHLVWIIGRFSHWRRHGFDQQFSSVSSKQWANPIAHAKGDCDILSLNCQKYQCLMGSSNSPILYNPVKPPGNMCIAKVQQCTCQSRAALDELETEIDRVDVCTFCRLKWCCSSWFEDLLVCGLCNYPSYVPVNAYYWYLLVLCLFHQVCTFQVVPLQHLPLASFSIELFVGLPGWMFPLACFFVLSCGVLDM